MAVTKTAVRRALYGKMAGDTTLTNLLGTAKQGFTHAIYHQQAPDNAAFPFVVFFKSAGTPTYTFERGESAYETDVWTVKAVDRNTTADTAEAIASRLITLLTDASLSISGGTHLYLRRDSDIDYPEEDDGTVYRHVGSLWRLIYD